MIVVSDTTALTTLLKSGLDWLLPGLFGEILIPSAVAEELLHFHAGLPEWCVVHQVAASPLLQSLLIAVDPGEAEAVALAYEKKAELVLLDDKKGLRQAESIGLNCIALPALLVVAKRKGLISSVRTAFETIASKGRYRVADSAAHILLRSVGED